MGKAFAATNARKPVSPRLIADTAAKLGDLDLAVASARDALRYLEHAKRRLRFPLNSGRTIAPGMRATAFLSSGRVAAFRQQYKEAEQSLVASLTLNPEDMEALYTIGVVRMAVRADEGAAAPLHAWHRPMSRCLPRLAIRCVYCTRERNASGITSILGGFPHVEPARTVSTRWRTGQARPLRGIGHVPRMPCSGLRQLEVYRHGEDVQAV